MWRSVCDFCVLLCGCVVLALRETQQMTELMLYVPGVETQATSIIQSMLRYDVKRFREFRKKGNLHGRLANTTVN